MRSDINKDRLRRIFKYPAPCFECLDGPGHLVSHLLSGPYFEVTQRITLLGKIQLKGQTLQVPCIIMSTLCEDKAFSLARYFPEANEYIIRTLEEEIHEIISSQFLLLVMIWNTLEQFRYSFPREIGAMVVGIRKALRLPYDPKATLILGPLSLKLQRIGNDLRVEGYRFAERGLVEGEVTITSQLLRTNLAIRSIFGRLNSHRISCAQAVGEVQPALGWLPPYN
jgi:hypothetical protein